MNLNSLRLERGQIVDQMKNLIDSNPGAKWSNAIEQQYNALDKKQMKLKTQIHTAELDNELNQISGNAFNTGLNGGGRG